MSQFKDLQKEICEILEEVEEEEQLPPCEPREEKEEELLELEIEDTDVEQIIYKSEELFVDFKELARRLLKYTKFQGIHFMLNFKKLFFEDRPYYAFKDTVKIKKFLILLKPAIRRNYIRYKTEVKLSDVDEIKITFKKNKIKNIYVRSTCCQFVKLRNIDRLRNTAPNIVTYLKYFKGSIPVLKVDDNRNWLQLLFDISNNEIREESILPPSLESCIDGSAFDSLEDKLLSNSFSYGEFLQYILDEEVEKDKIGGAFREDVVEKYQNVVKYKQKRGNKR